MRSRIFRVLVADAPRLSTTVRIIAVFAGTHSVGAVPPLMRSFVVVPEMMLTLVKAKLLVNAA